MFKFIFVLCIFGLIARVSAGALPKFSEKVKSFTLTNGMTFYVYERHHTPTFTGLIHAKVGSVDEGTGQTGMAHFFEHMAFKGTPVIGTRDFSSEKKILEDMDKIGDNLAGEYMKGDAADQRKMAEYRAQLKKMQEETFKFTVKDEMDKIYSENGGEFLNAGTSTDSTMYFVMLPANRLELWFLMESERFKNPVLREFYSERDVIAEERRMFADNNPEGFMDEEFINMAFQVHPYRHNVVGYMEDIQSYTKAKLMNFLRTFYIPNNMIATIVGDVKISDVKILAEKYFGDIPRGTEPPRPLFNEPPQKGERRSIVKYDAEPVLLIGYRMPGYQDKDNIVLELIELILDQGNSSRFRRELVNIKKMAVRVSADANSTGVRYPSIFEIGGLPRYPVTAEELEKAVLEILEKLKTEPVSREELERVFNQREARLYFSSGFAENVFLAMKMSRNALLHSDLDFDIKRVEEIKRVTPEQIMEVAKRIFVDSNKTVCILHHK